MKSLIPFSSNSVAKKLFVILLFSAFYINAFSQEKLPERNLKSFEYVLYDLNSPRTLGVDKVEIYTYALIDINDTIKVIKKLGKETKYYTYHLTDSESEKINSFFDSEKKLKQFKINSKLKNGYNYAGYYYYIGYERLNNQKDQICFINYYMSSEFNELVLFIEKIIKTCSNKEFQVDELFNFSDDLLKEIYLYHIEVAGLPKITMPPPITN